ncbi:MAG: hypothetical protein WC528_04610 [Patescibacteria group bacterium]
MKIYFFAAKTEKKRLNDNYETISRILRAAGIDLYSNLKERSLPSDLAEVRDSGGLVLDQMEAFIIEGTESAADIGYLLALAISQKKPALYLYEKGAGSQEVLKYLSEKNIPASLKVRNYEKDSLEKVLIDFLKTLKGREIREVARIKFTLRITSSIEKYLYYKTHNTPKSKADFLREYIERMIKLDEDYQEFLKRGE